MGIFGQEWASIAKEEGISLWPPQKLIFFESSCLGWKMMGASSGAVFHRN